MSHGTSAGKHEGKREAALAALREVRSGMALGLGTGSTTRHFLQALADALREGRLERVRGVPTSERTREEANALGVPLVDLAEVGSLDLAVDGADEVDPALDLVKGLGGALLREKIVAQAARRFVVVADSSKQVERLGTRAPLPVEVAAFAWETHLPFFRALGAEPEPRRDEDGLVLTDNGNPIVDLRFPDGIRDAPDLERRLRARAGVAETGLFLGIANRVFVGSDSGVDVLDRSPATKAER